MRKYLVAYYRSDRTDICTTELTLWNEKSNEYTFGRQLNTMFAKESVYVKKIISWSKIEE